MHVWADSDVSVVNNVLVSHGISVRLVSPNSVALVHNDFWDNDVDVRGPAFGIGNLYLDPLFVDVEGKDFHLMPNSPLVDAGTNVSAPNTDFEGDPRIIDGDKDGEATVDMGADEFVPGWNAAYGVTFDNSSDLELLRRYRNQFLIINDIPINLKL